MRSIVRIALRRLRAPLIMMGVVFVVATLGLTLIPGIDADGKPWRMTLFEAFYFVTYTATTIGFGELPYAFSTAQRVFVTATIYLSVIGWAYLLGSLLNLVQEKAFQQAIVSRRFARSVEGLNEPFYLLCGMGETGTAVMRALDALGCRLTIVDKDEQAIQRLELSGLSKPAPGLVADARSPETLTAAGLLKPECQGVLALCNDDETNLAVAISACILRAGIAVVGRADNATTAASMTSLGTERVINPFREFAADLELAMRAPDVHRLMSWLTSRPGAYLPPSSPSRMPRPPGHWIVCGYGRLGRDVVAAVLAPGFSVTVVDPVQVHIEGVRCIKGRGADVAVLEQAGLSGACGLVAGTDEDAENLAIGIAARRLRPDIFVVLRQNRQSSQILFAKFAANMTMVPSEIIANHCVTALRTPLLADFLAIARSKDDVWAYSLSERLRSLAGGETPQLWSVKLDPDPTPGVVGTDGLAATGLSVERLTNGGGNERHACLALALLRKAAMTDLPGGDVALVAGDQLLFAGSAAARNEQRRLLPGAGRGPG